MHLHLVRVVARPKDVPRPAKVVATRGPSRGAPPAATLQVAAPAACRVDDEPRCGSSCGCGGTGIRTGLRSRRSQDHEGSTPSVRTSPTTRTKGDPDDCGARRCDDAEGTRCPHNFEPRIDPRAGQIATIDHRHRLRRRLGGGPQLTRCTSSTPCSLPCGSSARAIVEEFEPYDRRRRELESRAGDSRAYRPRPHSASGRVVRLRSSVGRAAGFDPARRGSNPLGGSHDTVAERRGTRLQSASRRFESARCLADDDNEKGGGTMSTIKTFGDGRRAEPRAARAVHGGG